MGSEHLTRNYVVYVQFLEELLSRYQIKFRQKFSQHTSAGLAALKNSRRLWRSRTRKSRSVPEGGIDFPAAISLPESAQTMSLVALYRAMRLRFGYGFESCDANGPRNVKNTNVAKHRPIFLPPLLLVDSKELVLKVPQRGQCCAAIPVTRKRCDSCGQVALGTQTVSRRNF